MFQLISPLQNYLQYYTYITTQGVSKKHLKNNIIYNDNTDQYYLSFAALHLNCELLFIENKTKVESVQLGRA